jgi:hypothetical protein
MLKLVPFYGVPGIAGGVPGIVKTCTVKRSDGKVMEMFTAK